MFNRNTTCRSIQWAEAKVVREDAGVDDVQEENVSMTGSICPHILPEWYRNIVSEREIVKVCTEKKLCHRGKDVLNTFSKCCDCSNPGLYLPLSTSSIHSGNPVGDAYGVCSGCDAGSVASAHTHLVG
jgi:hypothetical protein